MQVIFSDSCRLLPARIAVKFSMSAVWHAQPGEQVRIIFWTGRKRISHGSAATTLSSPPGAFTSAQALAEELARGLAREDLALAPRCPRG
jgi:hypothetical protein